MSLGLFSNTLQGINQARIRQRYNQFQKNFPLKMQHWCFNCSKITFPKAGMKCQYCFSEAIEEIKDQNNPAQYIPFTLPPQSQPQPQTQPQQAENELTERITITFLHPMRLLLPPFLPISPVSFIRIITFGEEDNRSTPVDDQKFSKLEKIGALDQQCAVCQEKSGAGVKLNCRHEFHEDCIKPWFKNANTCPCCRATV